MEHFKEFKNPSLCDHLKRYANIPHYVFRQESNYLTTEDDDCSASCIRMDCPVASLLKFDGRLFVCFGKVNDLVYDSKHFIQISMDQLSDTTSLVSFQLLHLIPASKVDDPSHKNDWCWSFGWGSSFRVPGRLIESVNPALSTKDKGKPYCLFETGTPQAHGSLFLKSLT
jgi:hypothetical protein